jgi:hypothetical protein
MNFFVLFFISCVTSSNIVQANDENFCAICLANFHPGNESTEKVLSCVHDGTFHDACIRKWLGVNIRNKCPLCSGLRIGDGETPQGFVVATTPGIGGFQLSDLMDYGWDFSIIFMIVFLIGYTIH